MSLSNDCRCTDNRNKYYYDEHQHTTAMSTKKIPTKIWNGSKHQVTKNEFFHTMLAAMLLNLTPKWDGIRKIKRCQRKTWHQYCITLNCLVVFGIAQRVLKLQRSVWHHLYVGRHVYKWFWSIIHLKFESKTQNNWRGHSLLSEYNRSGTVFKHAQTKINRLLICCAQSNNILMDVTNLE